MLTGFRDGDIRVLKNLNDKDLFNIISRNRRYDNILDEKFWRDRFLNKYPDFEPYKSDITWKQLYLKFLYDWRKVNTDYTKILLNREKEKLLLVRKTFEEELYNKLGNKFYELKPLIPRMLYRDQVKDLCSADDENFPPVRLVAIAQTLGVKFDFMTISKKELCEILSTFI